MRGRSVALLRDPQALDEDCRAGGDHLGYRGLPLLGTLADAAEMVAALPSRS